MTYIVRETIGDGRAWCYTLTRDDAGNVVRGPITIEWLR